MRAMAAEAGPSMGPEAGAGLEAPARGPVRPGFSSRTLCRSGRASANLRYHHGQSETAASNWGRPQSRSPIIDVGTNIWARIRERSSELALEVRADITNFAMPDQQSRGSMPLLRQLQINGSTVAIRFSTSSRVELTSDEKAVLTPKVEKLKRELHALGEPV